MKLRAISATRIPVAPVMMPAERSNSPPIINSATATAMMPERSGDVEDRRECRHVPELLAGAPEERPHDDRTDHRPDLGREQQPLDRTSVRDPLVTTPAPSRPWPRLSSLMVPPRPACAATNVVRTCSGRGLRRVSPARTVPIATVANHGGDRSRADAQRVPAATRSLTAATLLASTKPGPVYTGRPPPVVLALVMLRYSITTGR